MRHSYLTLISISALCVGCGDDDNKGSKDSTESTTTTTTTGSPSTTTSPTNSTTSGGPTSGTGGGSGGSTSGSGGTTNAGGSAGDNSGGSAGAPGGTGGPVVVVEDCGYEACGGDLAGTEWSYSRICVEEDDLLGRFSAACSTIELLSSSGEVNGTIGFDADSFTQNVSFSITGEFGIPASCNPLGCAVTAAVLGTFLDDASCTDAGGGCTCTGTLQSESTASGGDYAADGDNLTLDGAEGTYCASGDSFKYTGEIEMVPFVYEAAPQ